MPKLSQGDIFQAATRVQLAIVFGHLGFNEMHIYWNEFRKRHPELRLGFDPFNPENSHPIEWAAGKWLWFVPEEENHGMTERQLSVKLDRAFLWAAQNGILSVATNGIANIDHELNTADNRQSDEERAAWLKAYAEQAEKKYKINIELISLNDIFLSG